MRELKTRLKGCIILLLIGSMFMPQVFAEEEYNHFASLQSEVPQGNSWYGYQFSMNDDLIVTGEPYAEVEGFSNAGKGYLYDTEGNLITILLSPDPGTDHLFGHRLALYEDIIVIHEAAYINGLKKVGKVHVYNSDGALQYSLQPQELIQGASFGFRVAIDEDIILISEPGTRMSPYNAGMVHVYSHDGEFIRTILSPDPQPTGVFGHSLEIGDGKILVGQFGNLRLDARVGPGYVFAFDYDGNHLMTIEAPEPEERACFGNSVSLYGDKIAIGELYATVNGVAGAGRAYIFNTDGEHLQTLLPPSPSSNAKFGKDVNIDVDTVVVGEEYGDINPYLNEGKAHVFNIDGTLIQTLTAPDPTPRGAYGLAVDIHGEVIAVGECWAEVEGEPNSGKLHLYALGVTTTTVTETTETSTVAETEQEQSTSGGIPGFPYESIIIGLVAVVVTLWLAQRRQ